MARKLKGRSYTWQIGDNPIGSGDAGEVYLAVCLENPAIEGVIKKPTRIATGGTIQRQANQIAQESLALAKLDGLENCKAHPPKLIDIAPEFTQGSANFFMVSESAPGEDMARMLTESRQSGKPFPRRVIITVLDALFDLFSRAHKAGVLWNDVKLDHIYWHNPTGQVAVIDWGNAQFLDRDAETGRRTLPRWEDYQQLVDTLGAFLKDTAPELYDDLGWEDFEGKELDLPQVSVLARRIAYQQELVGLRVMEYQALINVEIGEEPSLERLQKIVEYQHRLNQIGAPWDSNAVLEYSKSLIIDLLANGDRQKAIRATSIIWDLFDENLDLPWHLLREYFRNLDIISHNDLFDLVKATFNQNWSHALWIIAGIAREVGAVDWWEHLVPVLRQKALGTATRRPYKIGLSLLEFMQSQGHETQARSEKISAILKNWHQQSEQEQGNPFDYQLLEFIQRDLHLPRHLLLEAKSSFAAGQNAVREVIKAWDNMNWDNLSKSFSQVISWDPERWGVLSLAEDANSLKIFLDKLYEGPAPGIEPATFFDQIFEQKPDVEQYLGSPSWLASLNNMLEALKEGQLVSNLSMEINLWCPWLLAYETLYGPVQKSTEDESIIQETLNHFSGHIKNWSDLDHGLERVKQNAPQYHPACKKIIENFHAIGNLNIDYTTIASNCQDPPHEVLRKSCDVVLILTNWRGALGNKDYQRALTILEQSKYHHWRIIDHAHSITLKWINEIQPALLSLIDEKIPVDFRTDEKQIEKLSTLTEQFKDLKEIWRKIYTGGINNQILESLSDIADSNRANFLEWRRFYEHTKDRFRTLVYYYDLDMIRQISDNFLRISQHIRQALHSFYELQDVEHKPFVSVIKLSENLLNHLLKVEEIIIPNVDERSFSGWIESIQTINHAQTHSEMRDVVLKMSPDHPLYAWLVQSLLAK